MQETHIRSLGRQDPLEKGNGYPLQYSCLESPMDRGAWQATVYGVAESDTAEVLTPTHTPPWPPVAARVPLWALRCSMASNGHLSQLKPKVLTLAREALQDLTLVHPAALVIVSPAA